MVETWELGHYSKKSILDHLAYFLLSPPRRHCWNFNWGSMAMSMSTSGKPFQYWGRKSTCCAFVPFILNLKWENFKQLHSLSLFFQTSCWFSGRRGFCLSPCLINVIFFTFTFTMYWPLYFLSPRILSYLSSKIKEKHSPKDNIVRRDFRRINVGYISQLATDWCRQYSKMKKDFCRQ